jgi:hypothetical protein
MTERERFEAWARQFHFDLTRSDCNSAQPYVNECTDWCWLAWRERSHGVNGIEVSFAAAVVVQRAYEWYESSHKSEAAHALAMAVLRHKTALADATKDAT